MSSERIRYENSPIGPRLIALVIDLIFVAILSVLFWIGVWLEWSIFWDPIVFQLEWAEVEMLMLILMVPLAILVYFILVPSITNGQTIGKLIMGLFVVYDDNSSTKRKFVTHIKRLFFMRGGTKVVKVVDERPEGL